MRWKQLRRTYLDDMWEEMGWDEKSWDEVRRAHMIWDEMKCRVRSASVKCKCEVWRVQCEVWGKSSLGVALHRGFAQVMFLDNNTATALHQARAHGPGWRTAHANSIDGKGLIVYPWGNFRPASCGYYWYMINKHVYQYLYIYIVMYIYMYMCVSMYMCSCC